MDEKEIARLRREVDAADKKPLSKDQTKVKDAILKDVPTRERNQAVNSRKDKGLGK